MNKFVGSLMLACILAAPMGAFAQDAMKQDSTTQNTMKKDDAMKKDDSMKKDDAKKAKKAKAAKKDTTEEGRQHEEGRHHEEGRFDEAELVCRRGWRRGPSGPRRLFFY